MRFAAETDKNENDPLYKKAESGANRINLRFIAVMSLFMIIAEILNEFGLFKVPRHIMLPVTVTAVLIFCIPVGVYFFGGVLRGRGAAVLQDGRFKYVILTASYVGIMLVCVSPQIPINTKTIRFTKRRNQALIS